MFHTAAMQGLAKARPPPFTGRFEELPRCSPRLFQADVARGVFTLIATNTPISARRFKSDLKNKTLELFWESELCFQQSRERLLRVSTQTHEPIRSFLKDWTTIEL